MRSIPGWGRSPGEGNGNPLQYSCLENPMDRGAWWATAHGVTKSNMTKWLRNKHPPFSPINWGTQCLISIIHMDTFDHTTIFVCSYVKVTVVGISRCMKWTCHQETWFGWIFPRGKIISRCLDSGAPLQCSAFHLSELALERKGLVECKS